MSIHDYKLARPALSGGFSPRGRIPKLTMAQCREVRKEYEAGAALVGLAKRYDVDRKTIYAAIHRAGGTLRPRVTPR